jgi:hypothetical protein
MRKTSLFLASLVLTAGALSAAPAKADPVYFGFGAGDSHGRSHGEFHGHGRGHDRGRDWYCDDWRHGHRVIVPPVFHRPYHGSNTIIYTSPPVTQREIVYVNPPVDISQAVQENRYCREYQTTIHVGHRVQQGYGTACQQPDGSWQPVN